MPERNQTMSPTTEQEPVSIHSRGDAAAIVPTLLGFHPIESIVILGIGADAPTARMDFQHANVGDVRDALMPAIGSGHWGRGCVVAIFTQDSVDRAEEFLDDIATWLPGVPVFDAFRVTSGECFGSWEAIGEPVSAPVRPLGKIAASRAGLVPDVQSLTDINDVLTKAIAAYKSGNGAAAWIYLDRLEDLVDGSGNLPERARTLASRLLAATNPRGIDL
ncbi:MAG: hypothetical protein JWP74_1509 [Marmoricola sp.]|nr:hypothetical protein [Marmoricola sp.]